MKRYSLVLFFPFLLSTCSKKQSKDAQPLKNIFYDKAYEYRDNNKKDSAYVYFNKAKDLFLLQKDSLSAGKCLVNMAIISTDKGDFFGGQEIAINAISFFDEKDIKQFAYINSNFNNLGIATSRLEDYEQALKFYDLAIKFSNDSSATLLYLNNKANVYQTLKEYQKALNIYNQILELAKNQNDYAMVLNNMSFTKWLQNPNYNATPFLLKALKIRIIENDLFGQNSSYATLADFYAKKKPDSALIFARKMYEVAEKINIADDKLQALHKIIKFSPSNETKRYFEIYNRLDDSVEISRNNTKNRFALIRYETEKSKADNLVLQKDNTEKKYQIIKGEILLYSSFFVLLAGTIISIIWYKKRKQKIALETQNAIRESRLKTSKKVHDVVANGLYRVMTEIENTEGIDKEEMLDRLDQMYQKSRDISYEVEEVKPISYNFNDKITALLQAFTTPATKVTIKGNTNDLWANVNTKVKHEIEHVLQELMVNMKKHSHATAVDALFEQKNKRIYICYIDNGIGMAKQVQYKNGLRNTGNRIEHIGGEITFDTKLEKGLKIMISFPVA